MFTRSAQVVAVVSAPLATLALHILGLCILALGVVPFGNIAFAAPHQAVFPLMAVAVVAMGVELVLPRWKVVPAPARTDHETLAAPLGLR